MKERKFVIKSVEGLHLKPAQSIVQAAMGFEKAEIRILHGDSETDLKSILDLLSLGLSEGAVVHLRATGEGAEAALDAIEAVCRTERLI